MVLKNFSLSIILLCSVLFLKAIDNDKLHGDLVSKYDQIKTFQADVRQTSYYNELDIEKVSEGKIYYTDEKLALSYSKPANEKIIFIDNVINIYQAEQNILIKTAADSSLVTLNMGYFIKHYWDKETAVVTSLENNEYLIELKLVGEYALSNIQKVELRINLRSLLVERISYSDENLNQVTLELSNILLNEDIPSSSWDLDIKDDTQIVDYR